MPDRPIRPTLAPRIERRFTQTIHASPADVFPLLCPESETRWLSDWTYRMIHSETGVAEPGAVFETPHATGRTLWVITAHEPDSHVAFARWQPDDLVVQISIHLSPAGVAQRQTHVDIRYVWTGVGPLARAALEALTEDAWRANMAHWERSMNAWFASTAAVPATH